MGIDAPGGDGDDAGHDHNFDERKRFLRILTGISAKEMFRHDHGGLSSNKFFCF